ncbi:hypothetical protein M569_09453, partial [Genlisea aurea]
MQSVSSRAYRGLRSYWRRRGYERLDGGRAGRRRRRTPIFELPSIAEAPPRRRRFWRLKLTPRIRFRFRFRFSPKKFLVGLRDAYVNMMLKLASAPMISAGYAGSGVSSFGVRPMKEYDERMIVEIYRSIVMAQGQIVPRDAVWIGSEIACRR